MRASGGGGGLCDAHAKAVCRHTPTPSPPTPSLLEPQGLLPATNHPHEPVCLLLSLCASTICVVHTAQPCCFLLNRHTRILHPATKSGVRWRETGRPSCPCGVCCCLPHQLLVQPGGECCCLQLQLVQPSSGVPLTAALRADQLIWRASLGTAVVPVGLHNVFIGSTGS